MRQTARFPILCVLLSTQFAAVPAALADILYSQALTPVSCAAGTVCPQAFGVFISNPGSGGGLLFNSGADNYLQGFTLNVSNLAGAQWPGSLASAGLEVGLLPAANLVVGLPVGGNVGDIANNLSSQFLGGNFVSLSAPADGSLNDVGPGLAAKLNWKLSPNTDYYLVAFAQPSGYYGWNEAILGNGLTDNRAVATIAGSVSAVPEPSGWLTLALGTLLVLKFSLQKRARPAARVDRPL